MNAQKVTVYLTNGKSVEFNNVAFNTDRTVSSESARTYVRTGELYIFRERKVEVANKEPVTVHDDLAVFAEGVWEFVSSTTDGVPNATILTEAKHSPGTPVKKKS